MSLVNWSRCNCFDIYSWMWQKVRREIIGNSSSIVRHVNYFVIVKAIPPRHRMCVITHLVIEVLSQFFFYFILFDKANELVNGEEEPRVNKKKHTEPIFIACIRAIYIQVAAVIWDLMFSMRKVREGAYITYNTVSFIVLKLLKDTHTQARQNNDNNKIYSKSKRYHDGICRITKTVVFISDMFCWTYIQSKWK